MFARSVQRLVGTRFHVRASAVGSPFLSLHGRGVVRSGSQWARTASRGEWALEAALVPKSDEAHWRTTAAAFLAATLAINSTHCEAPENTPSVVGSEDIEEVTSFHNIDDLPVYSSEQVAENDGQDGKPNWMTYGGVIYDVTDFIPNHPGGSEQILKASGSAVEPYWHLYRQHYASDLPMRLMEHMMVGRLRTEDQEAIDEQMAELQETGEDPYAQEPIRHRSLRVHSDTPMNAEVPAHLLTKNYLTPASLFYIRHHHPVPRLTNKQVKNYTLTIDLTEMGKGVIEVSLEDIKKLPKVHVTATLQCSGNRRSGFNEVLRTSGTSWGQGAVSTADWGGARLTDVLKLAGLDDPIEAQEKQGMEHVRFFALDDMMASIGIEKAMSPYGDVIICYEMNGEPLPRDHGFPLRVVVPGYAAVRNVKWLKKLQLSTEEAEGPWQRGLNYKTLPPSVTDAKSVDLDRAPSMTEASLFSGITSMARAEPEVWVTPGDTVMMKASGWAWAGGGRNIVRVDLSGDEGKTWTTATLTDGANQRFGRAWAWVFWEAEVPTKVKEDGSVHLVSKAVDLAFNVQPEKCDPIWNVRGLGNNSWYHASAKVTDTL